MKGLNAVLGWLLMLAVLAVPSFLFYNWWETNKQSESETIQASSPATSVFPPSQQQPPAVPAENPQEGAEAAANSAPSPLVKTASADDSVPKSAAAVPVSPPSSDPVPSQAAAASEVPSQPDAEAPASARTADVSISTQTSWYHPKSTRDPTLSPQDYYLIRELEKERRAAERSRLARENYRPKEVRVESRLLLQGIVGNAAIINGEMYTAGQTVYGAKILKVGANYIIGEHKGRRFRKVLR
ncbi:MAG: hypothetical protein COT18_03240 [Elusimicrobia bacterium CG08_land_8_20_14_0_20_59_10]|nr:MAG: hypothetical protein COT18_03240 [Elusimicrobia bacterium CG08_land_8_20_14_0_20_59_10]